MPLPTVVPTGVLLVGHGTRSEIGRREFLQQARLLRQAVPPYFLEACFLELAEPAIPDAVHDLVGRGIGHLVICPVLLFSAGHAKTDVPRAVADALGRGSRVCVSQTEVLGCHPKLIALSQRRFDETLQAAVQESPMPPQPDCHLVMVGRGSRDDLATAEMHRFTQIRTVGTELTAETCFVAMAQPSIDTALLRAAVSKASRIVVQPHLLFHGDLLESIRHRVTDFAIRYPGKQWLIAERLGPSPLVAEALADRIAKKTSGRIRN